MKSSPRYKLLPILIATLLCGQWLTAQAPSVSAIGPDGGIVSVVRGTANDDVVLIGTRNNGIYRSLDGGANWAQTSLTAATVNDLVFHPSNPQIVYAATRQGLYISSDAGISWTITELTIPTATLAIYPSDASIMFAGAGTSSPVGLGLFKTIDGGVTWTPLGGLGGLTITSLVIDTVEGPLGNVVYAGTDSAGVYQSKDGGNSWKIVGDFGMSGWALRIHSLALAPGPILTAGTSSGQYFWIAGQWFASSDGIADEVAQCSAVVPGLNGSVEYYVGTKGSEESFSPRPVKGGLYRLTNPFTNPLSLLGTRWDSLFNASLDVNSIFIPSLNGKKIYIATSDGIYISGDAGKSWARHNVGVMISLVRAVAMMNSSPNVLIAGVYGGGIHKSTNGGTTWAPSNSGIENPYVRVVVFDPKSSGILYSASINGLYKSVDIGSTWQKLTLSNIPHDSLSAFNNNSEDGAIKISPVNTSNLFVSALTGEFIRSVDGGATWTSLTPPQQVFSAALVENIEFDPVRASTLFFSANGVWKSTDLGSNWKDISGNLPKSVNGGVALYGIHPRIDPKNDSVIYLPTIVNSKQYCVYKTADGGTNWDTLSVKAFDVAIDAQNSSTLFCAGSDGIFRSLDAGKTWTKIAGDGVTQYYSITQSPANRNIIFVGSSNGVTRVQFGTSLEVPQTSVDFDVHPIGSSSAKNITFNNNGQNRVTITLSTASGSSDFSLSGSSSTVGVDAGSVGTFTVQFMPKSAGSQQATLTFTTDDPTNPVVVISLRGTGVAKAPVTRRILLETTHGVSSNLGSNSIAQYLSQFVQTLQQSGINVVQDQTAFDPLAAPFDALVIAAPRVAYSLAEIAKIRDYVVNGGFLVMLGDSGKSEADTALNGILTDFRWVVDPPNIPTGLKLNNDVVYDYTTNYLGIPASPIFTSFVDPAHPFTKGVTSVVPFYGSSVSVSDQAVPFLKGNSTTIAVTGGTTSEQPIVAGLSQVGKGKIFLLGDVDIWSNSKSDSLSATVTGILAGKNLQFALNVFGYVENYAVKLPKPTLSDKYQIISIPFDLSNFSVLDVLKDLGNVDKTKWRLYGKWTGTQYIEFPSPDFLDFKRGEGYWLITKGERDLTLGMAKISSQQGFHAIPLDSGYNLIGNPFPYRVSWANSQRSTPDSVESWLWGFSGAGFQMETDVMQPFTGYFLKSLHPGVTIYINPTEVTASGSLGKAVGEQRRYAAGEWEMQIKASNGAATDEDNVVGVSRSASDEWDTEDFSEPPPAPTDYLALSFNHREWRDNPGRYAGDIRAVHPEGNYWDLDAASAKAEANVTIDLVKFGTIPSDFEIVLVDMTTERVNDVSSSLSYNFTLKKNESVRSFRLIVGRKEFVEKNTNGIPIVPLQYSLDQNFPNPFNPSTRIHYTVGHSGRVQLDIFNVLGQKVKTLFNGDQRIGSYSLEWNGTNDVGGKISSGIYFCRMRTEEFTATKKMIFLN
jgi:photosystem II stability/assembly factor-like uncharacterized protein